MARPPTTARRCFSRRRAGGLQPAFPPPRICRAVNRRSGPTRRTMIPREIHDRRKCPASLVRRRARPPAGPVAQACFHFFKTGAPPSSAMGPRASSSSARRSRYRRPDRPLRRQRQEPVSQLAPRLGPPAVRLAGPPNLPPNLAALINRYLREKTEVQRAAAAAAAKGVRLVANNRLETSLDNHRAAVLCLIAANLIQNAITATGSGRTVSVVLTDQDELVSLTVAGRRSRHRPGAAFPSVRTRRQQPPRRHRSRPRDQPFARPTVERRTQARTQWPGRRQVPSQHPRPV